MDRSVHCGWKQVWTDFIPLVLQSWNAFADRISSGFFNADIILTLSNCTDANNFYMTLFKVFRALQYSANPRVHCAQTFVYFG